MVSMSEPRCNCCGMPAHPEMGADCQHCGYPIHSAKEATFLAESLSNLRRVARYGGANTTVTQLIDRYQQRLSYIRQQDRQINLSPVPDGSTLPEPGPPMGMPPSSVAMPVDVASVQTSSLTQPEPLLANVGMPMDVVVNTAQTQHAPARMFSLKSFFADQTINVVASLGAFLILVGSVSFIATSTDNLLSFIVVLLVHALFGIIGAFSYRLRSLRIVSVIYTAIFALQVPLVGFAGYRFVSGNLIQLSAPTLIAIAAGYAALVYAALAVYQKFAPFAYLAVVALVLADLAVAFAYNLSIWWWPCMLMLLALPALVAIVPTTPSWSPFRGSRTILREPVRTLMFICVATCVVGIAGTLLYSLSKDMNVLGQSVAFGHFSQVRFALVSMTALLLAWTCLFTWLVRDTPWMRAIPYLFLACVLALLYAFVLSVTWYIVALTVVALLYEVINRIVLRRLPQLNAMGSHLEGLALLLVGIMPLIVDPWLPLQSLSRASKTAAFVPLQPTGETIIGMVMLVVGCMLTLSSVLMHCGWRKKTELRTASWGWLLLLSGFVLNWLYGMAVLLASTAASGPLWGMLVFTLLLVAAAFLLRRFTSNVWAQPLEVLQLYAAAQTLLLSLSDTRRTLALLLCFAILAYAIVLYQRRDKWLFLSGLFALLAWPLLLSHTRVLLIASWLLPFAAALVVLLVTRQRNILAAHTPVLPHRHTIYWEWPLLLCGLFYGTTSAVYDANVSISTLQAWLGIPFPATLELLVLSLVWYASAVLARRKPWLVIVVGYAIAALLFPTNTFFTLALCAPLLALLALGISRLVGRDWAIPPYSLALFAALMMGNAGYQQGQVSALIWVLLLFAVLIYVIGVVEREPWYKRLLVWSAVIFASWSAGAAVGVQGKFYYPLLIVLFAAAIGITLSCLRFVIPSLNDNAWRKKLFQYALPCYATALLVAVITGIGGTWKIINSPFLAAVPVALLVYALVAYGILCVERRPGWLWIVAIFALWSACLLPQTIACGSVQTNCGALIQTTSNYLVGLVLLSVLLGLLAGRFAARKTSAAASGLAALFRWSWPWYLTTLVAMVEWDVWSGPLLPRSVLLLILCAFIGLSLVVLLVERVPEILLVTTALAAWTIPQTAWPLWQQMSAYTLLCTLLFASQFVWRILPPVSRIVSPAGFHAFLGLGGHLLVVLTLIVQENFFSTTAGSLTHVGAASLGVLAVLLCWYGWLQTEKAAQRYCYYGAGLLLALVVPWELDAFHQTELALLTLTPATYLIVIAPFLSHDSVVPQQHRLGQLCAIGGACLLLLPTLWSSFSEQNLQLTLTLILAGESLLLLLIGTGTRVRFFVLSGAGLIVISAIHIIFLPSLGIPPFLALILVGVLLLALATLLILVRSRLASLWIELE